MSGGGVDTHETKALSLSATPSSQVSQDLRRLTGDEPIGNLSFMQYKALARPHEAWVLAYDLGGSRTIYGLAVLQSGRLNRGMRVTLPAMAALEGAKLLEAIDGFASGHRVTNLVIEVIGREPCRMPTLPDELPKGEGWIYVIPLFGEAPDARFSANHRRNIRKAEKGSVSTLELASNQAVESHVRMCNASNERREGRGEPIRQVVREQDVLDLLQTGKARLYQAGVGGAVLSSKLIVTLEDGAFFDTAGTSPAGNKLGASHFLMAHIINTLRAEGVQTFNLGLSDEARPGLSRYKAGFGADRYAFQRITINRAGPFRRALSAVPKWFAQ